MYLSITMCISNSNSTRHIIVNCVSKEIEPTVGPVSQSEIAIVQSKCPKLNAIQIDIHTYKHTLT